MFYLDTSVVAAYYYLRIMMYMYFKEPIDELGPIDKAPHYALVMLLCVWALLQMGIFPRIFLLVAEKSVAIFG